MRLDIFVPFAKKLGPGRRLLKRLGPTFLSSPVRRAIQGAFFVLFLVLFYWVSWPYGGRDYAATRSSKEVVDAELFLALDPLVSITTAIAGRTWVWSLGFAAVMLLSGVIIPRGFCGYLCPLGTLIDLFDGTIGKRVTRFRVKDDGWWVHLKYYVLVGTVAASCAGVLVSGFVAAIPVLTRGLLFLFEPAQIGVLRAFYLVPPMNAGHFFSLALFVGVLGLGLLRPRFWCRYVCPTGAVFSVGNLFRATERKVESSCINCNKCVEICPFDAIKADFTTRTNDCTLCQTCGGVCPTQAIKFVQRWDRTELKIAGVPETHETPVSRRGFVAGALGGAATFLGTIGPLGAQLGAPGRRLPIRPPGSVPEKDFLALCIRCEACVKVCPNNCLQPMGFMEQGLEGLWTPQVVPSWSGCEPSCNNCGQVCPTGAIRALSMPEKRVARIGLAIVNEKTCLPFAGREACRMCVDECTAAGYDAIEFVRVKVELDEKGAPIEGSGFAAPVVLADKCVGCGLCQTRCEAINVKEKKLLSETAIEVFAGAGKEDRIMKGSYIALREEEARVRAAEIEKKKKEQGAAADYMPDFLKDK